MTSETVRQAASQPDLNHREPAFGELVREVRQRLLGVYPQTQSGWRPYLLGGSGTAAVEAMISSAIDRGPVLIVENGYYSARLSEIVGIYNFPHEVLRFGWEEPIDVALVDEALERADEPFEAVLMTHDETTLGRLNPVAEVAAVAAGYGTRVLVDAMSSFGADDLPLAGVHAVAASANKCLHGLPGVGFVLVREDLAKAMTQHPRLTYYLHLPMYEGEQPPLTPPTSALMAFRQALRENPGGQADRKRDYSAKNAQLRTGLEGLGLGTALAPEDSSLAVVSATLPKGWSYDAWFEANYSEGYVLYGTKGALRERYFQASVMGEIAPEHIEAWLRVADKLLQRPV
jgi:2-aminoethylphosphonate-pyruvate transaminase